MCGIVRLQTTHILVENYAISGASLTMVLDDGALRVYIDPPFGDGYAVVL